MSVPVQRDIIDVYDLSPFITRWTDHIIEGVSDQFGVTEKEMKSKSRTHRIVRARWAAFYFIRKHRGYSMPRIGGIFNKDHSTVVTALQNMERLKSVDPEYWASIRKIERTLFVEGQQTKAA